MKRPLPDKPQSVRRSAHVRSAISNGSRLPGGVRAGSVEGRRFADIMHDLAAEMGGDLSHAEELQLRTVAGLMMQVEQMQGAILKGLEVDADQFTRASNSAIRALGALKRSTGTRAKTRRPGDVVAYLAAKREGVAS